MTKEWIHNWSRKWLIDKDDLTKIRNHFGEKVSITSFKKDGLTDPCVFRWPITLHSFNTTFYG